MDEIKSKSKEIIAGEKRFEKEIRRIVDDTEKEQSDNVPQDWRKGLYETIFESNTFLGKAFDIVLLFSIIISVGAILLDSIDSLHAAYGTLFVWIEWIFTILFTIEYAARIISLKKPLNYIFSFFGMIDLFSILPSYLALLFGGIQVFLVLRVFRLLRIFRILKLIRFVSEGNLLLLTLKSSMPKIINFLIAVVSIVVISGVIMYIVEGPSNSKFTDIPTSIYWAVVTVSTVGYGDMYPITPLGKFFASLLMIIG